MNKTLHVVGVALAAFLGGCSTYSSNMMVGRDVSYTSLTGQREAANSVLVYESMPQNSADLGLIEAGRCHRMFTETPPDEALVLLDLKVAAYARGGNGITNVNVERVSALTKNCWYMLVGQARAFKVPVTSD